MAASTVFDKICSSTKLERDKGLLDLKLFISKESTENLNELQSAIVSCLHNNDATWESLHGCLLGAKEFASSKEKSTEDFRQSLVDVSLQRLDHDESRVRLAAGELLGTLCSVQGGTVYTASKNIIFNGIKTNLERHDVSESNREEHATTQRLLEKLAHNTDPTVNSAEAEKIFHDTAGWKSLETWMKCLQGVVDGCGAGFAPHMDEELRRLLTETLTHTNRFVREAGYSVCASLLSNCKTADPDTAKMIYNDFIAGEVARGLSDNWSQVRLVASIACRNFLLAVPADTRATFYPVLLPPLCLNRYYIADGVRIYNQDTWRQVLGQEGPTHVSNNIQHVVQFYVSQTEADNHAVREAACACIAELVSKMDAAVVKPHVTRLLDALLVCFNDDSWPVRDAACVACGNFILCFPDETVAAMPTLYPLFFGNLGDHIASVREGAAIALSNVVRAYGAVAKETVLTRLKDDLGGVKDQEATAERYKGLEKGGATYGVVKRARDNDDELHTDRQMYSCGSLAPKMGRGARSGGCMDHKFRKEPQPWERADGCVYLFGELCQVEGIAQEMAKFIPDVIAAAKHTHYTQHVTLLETVCKQVPVVATSFGKRLFKQYMEQFFDVIFYAMDSDSDLTVAAATQCLNKLAAFVGPNILRGRVENFNPKYMGTLNRALSTAPL